VTSKPSGTRRRILDAAAEIARETGPGNLALDAVAARAGVSKGGLLYHFPSKSQLMKGMVEHFLSSFEEALAAREKEKEGRKNGLMEAYLELFVEEHEGHQPPPSGLLAAMAEDPDFLAPVRRHHRDFVTSLKSKASDPATALVVFLAIQGVRSMGLLNLDILTDAEFGLASEKLADMLAGKDRAG